MLDKVLGWLVISVPFALSAIFIFIPSRSENRSINMRWRIVLVVSMALFAVLAWYQQKRAADASAETTNTLQNRLNSIDAHIGALGEHAATPHPSSTIPKSKTSVRSGQTLSLAIDGANIAVPDSPPNSTSLALLASVKNLLSISSVATDYTLSVVTPDKVSHDAVFIRLGNQGELRWKSASGAVTVIPASDALEDKTENHEIISGGVVRGRILFLLPGVPHDQVIDPSTKLILSAKDAHGKASTIEETIEEISKR